MIRAIFFDYGGTLDADGIPWKQQFQTIYESIGLEFSQEKFDRAFYDADDSLTAQDLKQASFLETISEQAKRVLINLNSFEVELHKKIVQSFDRHTQNQINKNRKILETFKQKYKLGIISNFYGNLEQFIKDLGLSHLFDVLADSNRVGCLKPDIKIFQYAINFIKIKPNECVMIGDSQARDMLGAKQIGMHHIWLVPPHRLSSSTPCCPSDMIISSLSEAVPIVEHLS